MNDNLTYELALLRDEVFRLRDEMRHQQVQAELDAEEEPDAMDAHVLGPCVPPVLGTGDVLPWTISSIDTTTPTLTTGDGYFVTHYDGGTRWDKLTGVSPTITGTGVLVAELTIDASTEAGTWTTAWKYITDAGITTLATAYSGMTAAGKSDGTHLRVPVWFVARSGASAPYTLTPTRMWFGHVENTAWRPPF